MKTVTFQIIEGVDKGRVYRDLPIPVSIGREEGNVLRLNDERVSRYHAKIQFDNGDVILTDLDSTNGTRINGNAIQIRRIQPGDRVGVGRSILLFGTPEEIHARIAALKPAVPRTLPPQQRTVVSQGPAGVLEEMVDPTTEPADKFWHDVDNNRPPLPQKLSPSQAARVSEILDFLHRGLSSATEPLTSSDEGGPVTIPFSEWQKIQAVQMMLASYLRSVAEPDPNALVE